MLITQPEISTLVQDLRLSTSSKVLFIHYCQQSLLNRVGAIKKATIMRPCRHPKRHFDSVADNQFQTPTYRHVHYSRYVLEPYLDIAVPQYYELMIESLVLSKLKYDNKLTVEVIDKILKKWFLSGRKFLIAQILSKYINTTALSRFYIHPFSRNALHFKSAFLINLFI